MNKMISTYIDEEICFRHINSKFDKTSEITFHSHDTIELLFIKKGDITYNVDGKSYKVKDNSLIITWPNKIHSIKISDSSVYDRYTLIFDTSKILDTIYNCLPKGIDVLSFGSTDKMFSLFEKLDYYYEHFEKEMYKKLVLNIIEEIVCNITIIMNNNPEKAVYNLYKTNEVLVEMIQYIDKHIREDFSLDDMGKDLHVSKSYIHKIFVQNMNITPKKYIIARRLVIAQKELKNNHKPTEVCLKYGYNDYSTFYRAYRNYFGVAPSKEVELKFFREMTE